MPFLHTGSAQSLYLCVRKLNEGFEEVEIPPCVKEVIELGASHQNVLIDFYVVSFKFKHGALYSALFFFPFIFISWRLITLQYCSDFCHTLTWISHGFTCVPHPDPPSRLPLHPIPLGLPSAPALSTCLILLLFLTCMFRISMLTHAIYTTFKESGCICS